MSEILLQAYRSQVAGLQLARNQSNEIIGKLMASRLDEEQRHELFQLVLKHCAEQETSRAAQLEAVMRTALLSLNALSQSTGEAATKAGLIEVVQALTLTVECANLDIKKENDVR